MDRLINSVVCGNCLDVMREMPENAIDAIVTDPPYGLRFMGKEWDHGVPGVIYWQEALRVCKPGAHLLAFGGTRTHHRLMVAIEDAGWEIRDCLGWLYGSGFPKSLDVSKAIDKQAGMEREILSSVHKLDAGFQRVSGGGREQPEFYKMHDIHITKPATESAIQWQGWGTALKPAWEPIVLARKPLDGTVAENVQKWGVGAINVDGCRVEAEQRPKIEADRGRIAGNSWQGGLDGSLCGSRSMGTTTQGRFPANILHDGSEEVMGVFPETKSGLRKQHIDGGIFNVFAKQYPREVETIGDSGSAARFFYCAKASPSERGKYNKHPTVKPIKLVEYLVKLIAAPGSLVLDPFLGSGTTSLACKNQGYSFIGIDIDPEYCKIAIHRIGG